MIFSCSEVMKMLAQLAIDFKLFRGIGVQVTKLTEKKKGEGSLSQFVTKGILKQVPARKATFEAPKAADSAPQIDQDVLAELPEDIRQEVLREYKIATAQQDAIAGPSTSSGVQPSIKSAAEVSFSQIDPTFLEALPEDLKLELVAELISSRTRQGADKVLLTGNFIFSVFISNFHIYTS